MRPRSSTRVLRPFSVSSLAAQPTLMPDPTTIASNEFDSMFYSRTRWKRGWRVRTRHRRHYGPLARSTGSVQPDVLDARRHRVRAHRVLRVGGPLRIDRHRVPADLDLQILLRAH